MAPMEGQHPGLPGGVTRTVLVLPSLAVTQGVESKVTMPVRPSQVLVLLQGGGCIAKHRLRFSFARDRERQGVI